MSDIAARTQERSGFARFRALLREGLRFVGSGLVVFPVGLLVSAFCHEILGWQEQYAGLAAFAVLLGANFLMARTFVFRSSGVARHELIRFMAIAVVMRGTEYGLFVAFFRWEDMPYLLAMVCALILSSAVKFFLYRTWVFNSARSRPESGDQD